MKTNVAEKIVPRVFNPLRAIEWIIALCTLVGGTYVFTPLYDISRRSTGPSVISQIITHPASIVVFGVLLIVGALLVIAGLKLHRANIRSLGWMTIILVRLFQIASTFVIQGFLPITWIYPFTLTLVCMVLWGWARVEVHRRGT